jgi:hypothetical protein
MSIPACQHVKDDGALCHAIAMRNRDFCYFHLDLLQRRKRMQRNLARQAAKTIAATTVGAGFAAAATLRP